MQLAGTIASHYTVDHKQVVMDKQGEAESTEQQAKR